MLAQAALQDKEKERNLFLWHLTVGLTLQGPAGREQPVTARGQWAKSHAVVLLLQLTLGAALAAST
eukprot:9818498-Karenia_brevis.AAC.1